MTKKSTKPSFGNKNLPAKLLAKIPPPPKDWRTSSHWKVFRIMAEIIDGFQFLADSKKTVTFFGSARADENNPWYNEARKLGRLLGKAGFGVVTGGGPGIMEAGNRGVDEVGGNSIGLNIQLLYEQRVNPYVHKSIGFHYFFTRKVMLSYSAQAYVFFPGGFGTLDELLELITLIQTKKIYDKIPIIMVGKHFWGDFDKFIKETLLKEFKTVNKEDTEIYRIVDTAKEALELIKKSKPRKENGY